MRVFAIQFRNEAKQIRESVVRIVAANMTYAAASATHQPCEEGEVLHAVVDIGAATIVDGKPTINAQIQSNATTNN